MWLPFLLFSITAACSCSLWALSSIRCDCHALKQPVVFLARWDADVSSPGQHWRYIGEGQGYDTLTQFHLHPPSLAHFFFSTTASLTYSHFLGWSTTPYTFTDTQPPPLTPLTSGKDFPCRQWGSAGRIQPKLTFYFLNTWNNPLWEIWVASPG